MDTLVSTQWLADNLGAPDLRILDFTWHMPSEGRDARAEYAQAHIPGAVFLDLDELSDPDHPAPHMMPTASAFGAALGAVGIGRGDRIVVYDNSPFRTAARGWFMLRHFGAERIAILDGGLGKWVAEGRPTERGTATPEPALFEAVEATGDIVDKAELEAGAGSTIADARGAARFEGSAAEPRPGVLPGHMPGARNLPFSTLYRDDGTLKSDDELRRLFDAARIDPDLPFVATCGSGVTANSLIFAARRLGGRGHRLYDGSWSEWGADPATPKETGPAR